MVKRLAYAVLLVSVAVAGPFRIGTALAQTGSMQPPATYAAPPQTANVQGAADDYGHCPQTYRGCIVNKTYSCVMLTIVRPRYNTTITVDAGQHCKILLVQGDAVFISSDPQANLFMAVAKQKIGGDTTITITPTTLDFTNGVDQCLCRADGDGSQI
jgi:hypothetical protein